MSEEVLNIEIGADNPTIEENSAVEVNNNKELPKGYIADKEAFEAAGNDPKDWVSPEEFDRRGKYFDQIKDLKRQNESMVEYIQRIDRKVMEAEMRGYQNAIQELELRKQVALEANDNQAVHQIDNQINQYQQYAQQQQVAAIPRAAQDFMKRHEQVLSTNPSLVKMVEATANLVRLKNPQMTVESVCETVEKELANELGLKRSMQQSRPSPVATPTRNTAPSDVSVHDLSPMARDIFESTRKVMQTKGKKYTVSEFVSKAKELGVDGGLLK